MAKKATTVNTHNDTVMAALAFIILGTILVSEQSLNIVKLAVIVFGVALLTLGVLELINKNLIVAICEIVVGVLGIALCLYAVYFLVVNWGSLTRGKLTLRKVIIICMILFALVAGILLIVAYAASVGSEVYIAAGAFALGAGAMIIAKKALTEINRSK